MSFVELDLDKFWPVLGELTVGIYSDIAAGNDIHGPTGYRRRQTNQQLNKLATTPIQFESNTAPTLLPKGQHIASSISLSYSTVCPEISF